MKTELSYVLLCAAAAAAQSQTIKFADLFAEESRELLLDLDLAATPQEGQQALIKVRWVATCSCYWLLYALTADRRLDLKQQHRRGSRH
jgi:hypothetical protein